VLEDFTYATFAGHLGDLFRLHAGPADVVALELVQATDLGSRSDAAGGAEGVPGQGERFAITFQGPHDRPLPQGTYQLEHDQIGSFPLFIVPVGAASGGIQYEAVFNRLPY
jgi:hypothetical protein